LLFSPKKAESGVRSAIKLTEYPLSFLAVQWCVFHARVNKRCSTGYRYKSSEGIIMVSKTRILLIDDDLQLVRRIGAHLQSLSYEVIAAHDEAGALKQIQSISPHLVVLGVNFPAYKRPKSPMLDGVGMLRRIRASGNVPIIVLSSNNVTEMKVTALHLGADDYVAKPFELQELSARIEAVLRRAGHDLPGEKVLTFHRLRLDPGERRAWKDGKPVAFTAMEFDILYALARRPDHVFTRDRLIELAWKGGNRCISKAVDVHIGHIRSKLEDNPHRPSLIVTVRGTGYRFEDTPK
jgi:DNA-binding response OmpR family regulator